MSSKPRQLPSAVLRPLLATTMVVLGFVIAVDDHAGDRPRRG